EEALLEMNRTLEAQGSLLRSREELLRVFVKSVPAPVAMLDRDMRYLQVSDRWCTDYLPGRAEILGHSHYELFPDMPHRWKEVHSRALQGETLRADEDRWDGQDGTHWARWEVRPWKTSEGAVGGILILAEDISHRKQMEEALSDLSRRLIESQEQERARIGRELHDDICQRVALLAIRLGQLKASASGLSDEIPNQLSKMEKETAELSMRIQQLSRELHSSTLEFLGLSEAIRSWCDEFGEKWNFEILFENHDVPSGLPSEISLNLFRVLQEALNNAAKYSGVQRFEVRLWGAPAEIHLSVTDIGKGFDISSAMRGRGLGLKSMRERVKLMNGHLTIESKPSCGTTIHVRVPVDPGDQPSQGINSAQSIGPPAIPHV
ncbi:MAG TPA: ATP-binding protein, partial [Terracidiphilus sp.]|nr:ATP-binding protein [Terracidiphilus sp.]